jgi:hypothetical protein
MKRFCKAVNEIFSSIAPCHPTIDDTNRLLDKGRDSGFPGCIGSMDCMHWKLKNCPSSWKGMFQGKSGRRARSDRRSQLLLLAFLLRITGLPE